MTVVSPSQSNAGDTIEASDINNPINQLAAVINGNIDATNIADGSVGTAKLADSSVTPNKITNGTGGSWTWQAWTPTWTNNTIGNSTVDATYCQIGKTIHFRISLTVGSTSNFGLGPFIFSLPVAPHANLTTVASDGFFFGIAKMLNVGSNAYPGTLKFVPSTSTAVFIAHNASSTYATYAQVTNSIPFGTGIGSIYMATGTYEAA